MEILALAAAFLLSVQAVLGEYIYVENPMGWRSAQKYCRDNYTDLGPVTTNGLGERLFSEHIPGKLWTGLYRDGTQWMWSGGSTAANLPWARVGDLAGTFSGCSSGCWWQCKNGLIGFRSELCNRQLPFLCYNLIVPRQTGTWEQALTYCRRNNTALSSLQTKTKHLLALSEVHKGLRERVWIGLRFLADQWVWINGKTLVFQAWNGGHEEHRCPALNRCGTLTKSGHWESWDCTDRLHFLCS